MSTTRQLLMDSEKARCVDDRNEIAIGQEIGKTVQDETFMTSVVAQFAAASTAQIVPISDAFQTLHALALTEEHDQSNQLANGGARTKYPHLELMFNLFGAAKKIIDEGDAKPAQLGALKAVKDYETHTRRQEEERNRKPELRKSIEFLKSQTTGVQSGTDSGRAHKIMISPGVIIVGAANYDPSDFNIHAVFNEETTRGVGHAHNFHFISTFRRKNKEADVQLQLKWKLPFKSTMTPAYHAAPDGHYFNEHDFNDLIRHRESVCNNGPKFNHDGGGAFRANAKADRGGDFIKMFHSTDMATQSWTHINADGSFPGNRLLVTDPDTFEQSFRWPDYLIDPYPTFVADGINYRSVYNEGLYLHIRPEKDPIERIAHGGQGHWVRSKATFTTIARAQGETLYMGNTGAGTLATWFYTGYAMTKVGKGKTKLIYMQINNVTYVWQPLNCVSLAAHCPDKVLLYGKGVYWGTHTGGVPSPWIKNTACLRAVSCMRNGFTLPLREWGRIPRILGVAETHPVVREDAIGNALTTHKGRHATTIRQLMYGTKKVRALSVVTGTGVYTVGPFVTEFDYDKKDHIHRAGGVEVSRTTLPYPVERPIWQLLAHSFKDEHKYVFGCACVRQQPVDGAVADNARRDTLAANKVRDVIDESISTARRELVAVRVNQAVPPRMGLPTVFRPQEPASDSEDDI